MYHISLDSELSYLTPRIPRDRMSYEDDKTPRVCFSRSILGACQAIGTNELAIYTVYQPIHSNLLIEETTVDEVPDAEFTEELWCLEEVEVKPIGTIQIYETGNIIDWFNAYGDEMITKEKTYEWVK